MDFKDSKTYKNLALSFSAECMAGLRYQMIADLLIKEGYQTLADTIKELAKNETWHAKQEMTLLNANAGDVNNINITGDFPFVAENVESGLLSAIKSEEQESVFYNAAAKTAEEEGYNEIADKFRLIGEIELHHREVFSKILNDYKNGTLFRSDKEKTYTCANCGHFDKLYKAWNICPVCGSGQGFVKVDFEK